MNFTNLQIQVEDLPNVEGVTLKPIAKSYLKIIALNSLALYSLILGALYGLKHLVKEDGFQDNFWYVFLGVLVICIINFIISVLAFKKRKYAVRGHDVIYAKGLIVHSVTTVPISRIQHVEESRSWLARHFGLSTLKIFTAGEAGSDLSIKGLPHIEAKGINDFISAEVNGNS
ncbi:PH domain-containing protein [Winogradskyella psychrotolerans]|uniref:PH domain-containing protein n=1 Tax=Winogradskyella psychrotolerans TaxID=1344585 RepID=UPI001C0705AC|nr:PH domain-containing protein [Winogradskyella psychrotolerans]MBU2929984.1 PH domain-containing protein [Winogradskyella psychrotolerans]